MSVRRERKVVTVLFADLAGFLAAVLALCTVQEGEALLAASA
jgi:class 3 adenylate cyclase